jgi:hypothetical protein
LELLRGFVGGELLRDLFIPTLPIGALETLLLLLLDIIELPALDALEMAGDVFREGTGVLGENKFLY